MTDPAVLKVGFVTESHYPRLGGMETFTHELASALSGLPETEAELVCSAMPDVPRRFAYPYPVRRPRSLSVLTRRLYLTSVMTMIRRGRPSLLHGMSLHGGGCTAVDLGLRFGLPVVVHSHGSDVQAEASLGYGASLQPGMMVRVRRALSGADHVLAVSRMNRDLLLAAGADPTRVTIVHPGARLRHDPAGIADLRPRLGLRPDDFVVITVGRNRPVKRLELLFQAVAHLDPQVRVKCLCLGPEEGLATLARKLGIEDAVRLPGSVTALDVERGVLANYMASADVYASLSLFEAFGLAALDALACGLPILITPRQGVRDVIREAETGFVLEEETPESLARLLLRLAVRRDELRRGRAAIAASVATMSWAAAAGRTRAVYEEVLDRRARPGGGP